MSRIVIAILVAVAATLGAGIAAARSAQPGSHARLVLANTEPLRIAGRQFHSGERVRLRARVGEDTSTRRVRATGRGSFAARFAAVQYDPCGSTLVVIASGSGGSKSSLKVPQRECPPKL